MEKETSPQREHKDRLFKAIFGRDTAESKKWRLELYNALNGTQLTDPDELKVNTIENVIYISMKNDISFLVDDQICLYEQQSSFNQNMPLRGFLYFSQLYQKYLAENQKDPSRNGRIMIPTPRFFVFYNGGAQKESRQKMRLSDSFIVPDKSGDFEWTAIILNVNLSGGESLVKTCRPLYDYSRFVAKVREESKSGRPSRAEMEKAVDWAIKENLLDGFFVRQKAEVLGMILEEFNREIYEKNVREDGYLEGRAEGLEEGREEKAVEDARNFKAAGVDVNIIAKCVGLSVEEVAQL